jgi:nitric oxide dioxygenase
VFHPAHPFAVRDYVRGPVSLPVGRPSGTGRGGTPIAPIHSTAGAFRMTQDDIALVQRSWSNLSTVKHVSAELFYVKLFELDPLLRLLYGDDLQLRKEKYLQLMDATVRGLGRMDVLMPAVRELGIRHPLFGDSDEHHASVAQALLWTLQKCLRADFTPQVRSAWIRTYGVLSQTLRMLKHS